MDTAGRIESLKKIWENSRFAIILVFAKLVSNVKNLRSFLKKIKDFIKNEN